MANLLLDTHVMLAIVDPGNFALPTRYLNSLETDDHSLAVSSVSLWEVAIKHRMGKLPLVMQLDEFPSALSHAGMRIVDISVAHILAELDPLPSTKDPFDRLLLATSSVERMLLATVDRALIDHPLAWRP
jgi:PIN domain nuclease of toxin-antitoxin system